jgi:hypothetical protein
LYDNIFRKSIESLKGLSDRTDSKEQLNRLEEEIESAYSEQKLQDQFNLLNKKISGLESNDHKPAT